MLFKCFKFKHVEWLIKTYLKKMESTQLFVTSVSFIWVKNLCSLKPVIKRGKECGTIMAIKLVVMAMMVN